MEFKPKDWVLVRDDDDGKWNLSIFSHKDGNMYRCCGIWWLQCIPYEGNEALIGTTDAPEEKHVWHAGDHVDVLSDFDDMWHPGFIVEIDYTRSGAGFSYRVESECFKSITSTGKVWCKADQLRKPGTEETPWRPKAGEAVEALVDNKWRDAVLITDDHDDCMPYRIRFDNGATMWCKTSQIRKPAEKKEPDEPMFKFGDKVQCREDGEWMDGLFIMDDHTTIRFLVFLPSENDTIWVCEEDIRRA